MRKTKAQISYPTIQANLSLCFHCIETVKFLNFGTPEILAIIYLKFKQILGQTQRVFCRKDANEIANSEDPDQTAPLGAV